MRIQNIANTTNTDSEDTKLQKILRRHCKRDKMNVNEAFQLAVDYEAAEYEENGRKSAANGEAHLAAAAAITLPLSSSLRLSSYNIDPAVEANRREIEELQIGQALLDDRITELQSDMNAGFQRIEAIILTRAKANSQPSSSATNSAAAGAFFDQVSS